MIALLALALAAQTPVIVLDERVHALLFVLTSGDRAPNISTSDYLAAADRSLRARTRLAVISAEQAGADTARLSACSAAERMLCWLSIARPDALAVRSETAPGAGTRLRYVFVLAVVPADEAGTDRIALVAIDAEESLARLRALPRELADTEWRERAENEIFAAARQLEPRVVSSGEVEAFFTTALHTTLRTMLEENRELGQHGSIFVRTARAAGAAIAIDGVSTGGLTAVPETELRDVAPGTRTLTFTLAGSEVITTRVEVSSGARTNLELDPLLPAPPESPRIARHAALYGGGALVIAGAVVTALGIARNAGLREGCLSRGGESPAECPSLGLASSGFDGDRAPSADPARVDSGGIVLVPLGLALGVFGASAAGGAIAIDDEDALWIPVAIGLVAGALTYGAGAAF